MGTVQDVLAVARRNIGFVEGPNNRNPYAPLVGHAQHQPWCASFVAAVMKRAGVPLPSTSAYTPTMANGFRTAGRWGHTGKPGDVVFFAWPGLGRIAHVGIVEAVNADGSYTCIEGNTDVKGGRSGGRVMRQARRANIAGFGRPAYADPPVVTSKVRTRQLRPEPAPVSPLLRRGDTTPKAKIKDVQRALHRLGYLTGPTAQAVDGDFGQVTDRALRAFQRKEHLTVNGRTDPPTWARLRQRVHA